MLDQDSWARITAYALGETSAEDAVRTRAWIEADPERQHLADELTRLVDAGPTALWNADAAWQRLQQGPLPRVAAARRFALAAAGTGWAGGRARRWATAAAILVTAGAVLVWRVREPAPPATSAVAPAPPALRVVTTLPGQTAQIFLSDGSHVTLAAASTLRFPAVFAGDRDVYLDGEAYFEVAHDSLRSFAVHTEHAVARDLGTRFNVRGIPGAPVTEVAVAEGLVELQRGSDAGVPTAGLRLAAGELGRLTPEGALVRRPVDLENYLAWMRGELVFDETPLGEALPRLSAWYDLDIQIGDPALVGARLSARLGASPSPAALRLLAAALDARLERRGRTLILMPLPAGSP